MDDRWAIDQELGESLQPHEREIAAKIAACAAFNVCKAFTADGGRASRDVHVRAHGCVKAEFIVATNLLPEFAQGVFKPGHRYAAWIRFSASTGDPKRSDAHGDVHAMAIKLLGVSGDGGSNGASCVTTTQDFILLNSPLFPAFDVADYLKFIRRGSSANYLVRTLAPIALGPRGALIGLRMKSTPITNPLTSRYWSTVSYRLGDVPHKLAVKYATIPRTRAVPTTSRKGSKFLRDAMIATLRSTDVTFDFAVQRRTSALSVEDPRQEWSEADAPLYTVATIIIPRQNFATNEYKTFVENLAFNPWHGLPQHRPLGSINRIRRVVYEITADLRRRLNGVALEEPEPTARPGASAASFSLEATGSPQ